MEEIFSEGQRRVREKHISLPYHRPKQRSLDEFLRRGSLIATVPLRTSVDELKEVWKQIEEKEKDAEIFYKSEDEPDSDSDEDYCPNEGNKKDSPTKAATDTDALSNENDINLMNTIENKSTSSENPSSDNSSPLKINIAESIENSENTENAVDFSLRLSEKFSDVNSSEGSQRENSAEFSLKLPDSSEPSCTESVKTVDTIATDSPVIPCNECTNVITENVSEKINPKDICDEKEPSLKEDKETPLVIEPVIDEIVEPTKDDAIGEKVAHAEGKEPNSNISGCKDSLENTALLAEIKNNASGRRVSDIMSESDPTFSLHLEESQDGLEIQANADIKKTEEIQATEKKKDLGKEKSPRKIDWMNLKGMSDDESDNEAAPKITLKPSSKDIILLDDSPPRINPGVAKLMEQFMKHSSFKTASKKKQSSILLNIVTTSKNEDSKINGFRSETLHVAVEEQETKAGPKNETPGAKLAKLRSELKELMVKRRQEEWQKRLQEHKVNEEEDDDDDDEKSNCGALLDDDDNFVPAGTESEDSDLEENDIDLSDKKKKKSAFVDDEAEEDEEESDEDDELNASLKKVKKPSMEKVIIEDEEYEGDDDIDDNDDDNNDEDDDEDDNANEDKNEDEDDEWMQPGQTKMRSQLSPRVLTNNLTSKVGDIGLDDSKFIGSFDINRFCTSVDESELNKTSAHEISGIEDLINVKNSDNVTESQVLELCSGQFQTQRPQIEDEEDDFVMSPTQLKRQSQDLTSKNQDPLLSSDEEGETALTVCKRRKAVLKFSDDEDETNDLEKEKLEKEDDDSEKENIEVDGDMNEDEEDDDNRSVMYDSEENEIVVTKKDVGQFFDKEAELSESEWGSEDEDEKGLDKMDEELGDQEEIDVDKVQKELGKIHMRKLLDDDQREINLLKERFLEDGELHADGKGREKNFKWQTINDDALDAIWRQRRNSEGDEPEDAEEGNDESEQLWRKMRDEREAFLKKNKNARPKDDEDLDETVACQFLQMSEKVKASSIKPDLKKKFDLDEPILGKSLSPATILQTTNPRLYPSKGSFLSRSTQILSRVGPIGATGNAESNMNIKATNNRNFVFASKSPTKADCEDSQDANPVNKRKLAPISPVANKKPKFMERKEIVTSNRKSLLAQLVFD